MLSDQAGINMANYCGGGGGGVVGGEGPDGSGHPSDSQVGGDSERHAIGGGALHCEGHVEGQL